MMAKTADYNLGPFTFPRGWLMVARATDVTTGPTAIRMFGRDLVLYRGESGRVVLLDAYCPHMQAHLAAEQTSGAAARRIEGDSIRCPYHSWRFGPDGKCDHIPYFDGPIPPAAKLRAWPAEERFGCIFAWHDPEGGAPDHDLPDLPEWDDPQWMTGDYDDLGTLDVHPQEILDNLVDTRHFGPIHGQKLAYFDSVFDGVVGRQVSGGGHETMTSEDGVLNVDAFYTGPGILIARYSGETDAVQIICHTPREDGVTQVWHGITTRALHMPATPADAELRSQYHAGGLAAFSQDFAIWRTKAPAFAILRLPTDGPFHRSRAWYKQFYNPRAEAATHQARANGVHHTSGMNPAPGLVAAE
ncbi:3-ketosteroid 9alpha-monooxygenase subunit A [Sphingobium sp. OAS761]|uniref:Rieske 2Fe-2S domain-containing protein n=1 Tax=Sphingobium sp. OAS761 TaxID=2817901 RepID=UPI00209D8D94|nr:Rieske 2Fe-2S domain-containing protein [Sphingobium sp. OAS761]MCP1472435.1 3-ketosteroid 9alpha-monooxygenase subunit A [Sphingobium sp. OAS761]